VYIYVYVYILVYMCLYECLNTCIYECMNDLEYKYKSLVSGWSISSGSSVKTATNTPVCSLLEGVSTYVLIIEFLLILSINNSSRTAPDKWELSAAVLKLLLMVF
jgi:hypothetical protein